MLSLDENPPLLAVDFILVAPKPGYGAVNLYWGFNRGHQKDLVLMNGWALIHNAKDTMRLKPSDFPRFVTLLTFHSITSRR